MNRDDIDRLEARFQTALARAEEFTGTLVGPSLLGRLARLPESRRAAIYDQLSTLDKARLAYHWPTLARPKQNPENLPPHHILFFCCGRGFGKALDLATPMPTPTGWTTMGDVEVGAQLLDEQGNPCTVTFATEIQLGRTCYEVEFDDGEIIVADAEHRWLTWDKAARKSHGRAKNPTKFPEVRTTEQILATLTVPRPDGHVELNHAIALCGALQLAHADLPVDPYVLGYWLGNGTSTAAEVTIGDQDAAEVLALLEAGGAPVSGPIRRGNHAATYPIGGQRPISRGGRFYSAGSLFAKLVALGVMRYRQSGHKHVPAVYLRASEQQRRALLAGLLDSDGHVSPSGHVEFSNTNRSLAESTLELAISLGFKVTLREGVAKLNGREIGPKYRVTWSTREPLFGLTRKNARCAQGNVGQASRTRQRFIVAVRQVETRPVRCITVDSPSHLFLAGRGMVPTHNTMAGAQRVKQRIEQGARSIVLIGPTLQKIEQVMLEGTEDAPGLLRLFHPDLEPNYKPHKGLIEFKLPPGVGGKPCIGYINSAEKAEWRGSGVDTVWGDEFCQWRYLRRLWDNIEFSTRVRGPLPLEIILTSTPLGIRFLKEIVADPDCVTIFGESTENEANVDLTRQKRKYEGTRLGLQELGGRILGDNPDALFAASVLDEHRVTDEPHNLRVVVAVDPQIAHETGVDDTGIIVMGDTPDGHIYVLADLSGDYQPEEWGRKVVDAYDQHRAVAIICETNRGGDLVLSNVRAVMRDKRGRTAGESLPIHKVHAYKGKYLRAEPVAALAQRGYLHMVGPHPALEDEMTEFNPSVGGLSPNRLDACVYGAYWLAKLDDDTPEPVNYKAGFQGLNSQFISQAPSVPVAPPAARPSGSLSQLLAMRPPSRRLR